MAIWGFVRPAPGKFAKLQYYLIDHCLHWEPEKIVAIAPIIREGIVGILEDFDRYEWNHSIYGDVAERYRRLLARIQEMEGATGQHRPIGVRVPERSLGEVNQ